MKILIVDDHTVVRQGVHRLLSAIPGAVISEVATADDAHAQVRRDPPDIIVLDINLDGASGLELLRRLKADNAESKVVIFSMHSEPAYAARAIKAGARGYVSKSASTEELTAAVLRVAAGERYIDSSIAGDLVHTGAGSDDPFARLTNREIEILRMLGEGKSLQGIADAIGIAYKTVANSLSRIKEKLDLERTSDLIRFSIESKRI